MQKKKDRKYFQLLDKMVECQDNKKLDLIPKRGKTFENHKQDDRATENYGETDGQHSKKKPRQTRAQQYGSLVVERKQKLHPEDEPDSPRETYLVVLPTG